MGYLSAVRMEEFFYEKLELRKEGGRMNNLEYLGQAMTDAGSEFGPGTPYGMYPSSFTRFDSYLSLDSRQRSAQGRPHRVQARHCRT